MNADTRVVLTEKGKLAAEVCEVQRLSTQLALRVSTLERELGDVDQVVAGLPEHATEERALAGGAKLSRAQRIEALIREADQNARMSITAHFNFRQVLKALDRAVEALESVRKSNHRRGHAACDEVLPRLRKTLENHRRSLT
jgi:inorganic triphosphatase YgiF